MDEQCGGHRAPQIAGYRITRRLGEGGSATVWRARCLADDSAVAIKVLRDPVDDQALHEYTVLQHAVHEHIVGLRDVTVAHTATGSRTAVVLELLAGGSLATTIAARGHLSPGECVTILVPLARALQGLHNLGIVHGDLSAGNVLLDSTGRPVLADLGMSRLVDSDTDLDAHRYGTEGFVAPEVLVGGPPSAAADVYAVGALGWLALTGEAPGHIACRRRLGEAAPGTPPALIALIDACLDPDPHRRPDAESLAADAYQAAPAQALRLTVAGDIGAALTRRLRAPVAPLDARPALWDIDPDAVEQLPWWRRVRRPRRPPRPRSLGKHRRSAPSLGGWTTAAAAVAATILIAVPWPFAASADEPRAAATTRPSATAELAPADVLTRPSGPREQPVTTMKTLVAARSHVITARDPARLTEVDAPGSTVLASDQDLLRALAETGVYYEEVRWRVISASYLRGDRTTAVIRARVDADPYREVSRTGEIRDHPGRRGVTADYHLRWVDGHWRVSQVLTAR